MNRHKGFTLLEVLIAMLVIGIALLALARTADGQLRQLQHLRQSTLAHWVADNTITRARLSPQPLSGGVSSGRESMGGQDFRWDLQVAPSPDPAVWRLDVVVFDADGNSVGQATGFHRRGAQ